jgi:predicted MFS family arabinose efflux permease
MLTLCGFIALAVAISPVLLATQALTTPYRLALAVMFVAAFGMGMGIYLPIGMRLALDRQTRLAPWLWGINGAASVLGSLLAMIISLSYGITACLWSGIVLYLVTLILQLTFSDSKTRVRQGA